MKFATFAIVTTVLAMMTASALSSSCYDYCDAYYERCLEVRSERLCTNVYDGCTFGCDCPPGEVCS
ncbi:hypothetical protein GQ42DRAFT_161824 [Ramicandelaber brevisporus]|nr:hypothetical protein GQ42DRAFT_161824 [Ramicandelaber brevisporus]